MELTGTGKNQVAKFDSEPVWSGRAAPGGCGTSDHWSLTALVPG
jgi:hypothetical protein